MANLFIVTTPLVVPVDNLMYIFMFQTKGFGGTIAMNLVCMRFPLLVATNLLFSMGAVAGMFLTSPKGVDLPLAELVGMEVSYCFLKMFVFRFITSLVDQSVRGEVASRLGAPGGGPAASRRLGSDPTHFD